MCSKASLRFFLGGRSFAVVAVAVVAVVCCTFFAVQWAQAATYYVATTGVDQVAGGTAAAPFRTIGYGLQRLASGDTLLIADGVYDGRNNYINDGINAIASGTASQPTVIKAQNPLRVRIRNVNNFGYYDSPLRVRGNYVDIDGFVFDLLDNSSTPQVGILEGSYHRLTRSIFRQQGAVDTFGGWLYVGGSYHLIEDVAGVGAARYGFSTGGPTDNSHHIIFRRVVGRFDFSPSAQPKATFNAYGNNDNFNVHHIWYQNCIAVDGQKGPAANAQAGIEGHYGAWYFPKNLDAGWITASLALNNRTDYAGFFVQELQGRNTVLQDLISWNNDGAAIRWNGTGSTNLQRITAGAHTYALYNGNSTLPSTLSDSWFQLALGQTLLQTNGGFSQFTNNAFWPFSSAFGTAPINPGGALQYLPNAATVSGNTTIGARMLQRFGQSGARWGEAGFDQLTNQALWPWPYEDDIKRVFAEPNTPLAGNTPASNNTVRGFTVATDAFGQPMTLTRYIWQYLGQPIPANIYQADALLRSGFE